MLYQIVFQIPMVIVASLKDMNRQSKHVVLTSRGCIISFLIVLSQVI